MSNKFEFKGFGEKAAAALVAAGIATGGIAAGVNYDRRSSVEEMAAARQARNRDNRLQEKNKIKKKEPAPTTGNSFLTEASARVKENKEQFLSEAGRFSALAKKELHKIIFAEKQKFAENYFKFLRETGTQTRGAIEAAIQNTAKRYGIQEDVLFGIVAIESQGNPLTVTKTNDRGLCGINEQTLAESKELGYNIKPQDLLDYQTNLDAFAVLYRSLLERFPDHYFAQVAWNRGPTRVEKELAKVFPELPKREGGETLTKEGRRMLREKILSGEINFVKFLSAKETEHGGFGQVPLPYKYPLRAHELGRIIKPVFKTGQVAYEKPGSSLFLAME